MDGCTVPHAPGFVARCSWHVPWTNLPARVSARASSALRMLRFCTAVLSYWRQAEWYAVWTSSWPLSAATICPMMSQEAVQFSEAFLVILGRARNACFTGRRVTPLPGVSSPRTWKRAGMKAPPSACSTGPKASPMLGMTFCTNAPYCWSDFYSTA